MARIVDTDNFGSDYPAEKFLLWPMKRESAEKIAAILNEDSGPHPSRFYKVEENDYELEPGFEP